MQQELAQRPIVCYFLGLCAGLSCGFSPWNGAVVLVFVPLLWRQRSLLVLLAAFLVGVLARPQPQPLVKVSGGFFAGQALVVTVPSTVRSGLATVVESEGKRYRLFLPASSPVNLGDIVKLRGAIVPLKPEAKPQKLEVASLRLESPVQTVHQGFWGWKAAMQVRRSFVAFIETNCQPVLVGLLNALSFNVTGDLGEDLNQSLRSTGTMHIVSASGLHVAIVSGALAWLLLMAPVPRWAQLLVLVGLLAFYAAAAGFHPPMIRAVAMVMVASFAYAFGREPDALSALALVGTCNLLWEPEAVAALGFQLSYLAVGFLVLFGTLPRIPDGLVARISSVARSLVRTSVVATVATAPLLAYAFGEIPVLSVLSNLLVLPFLMVVVVGSLVAWILSGVASVGVFVLRFLVEPVGGWILAVIEKIGSWDASVVSVPPFSPLWVVFVYFCLAALFAPIKRPADTLTQW